MTTRTRILASLLLFAACGDDGNSPNPDGGGGSGDAAVTCTTAALTIAVPGMVADTVVGGGADLTVAETGCTTVYDWFDPKGEDKVVELTGLTVGARYGITLQSETDDLSAYVTADCPPATGTVTGCSLFADEAFPFLSNDPELFTFTATAATQYVVVDTAGAAADLEDGKFVLEVTSATCGPQTEETDCTGNTTYCLDFACKQCVSGFDCSAGTPSCDGTNTCAVGPTMCTGDDAGDSGTSDDGPTVAQVLTAPTVVGTSVTKTAAICSSPATEEDWYRIDLAKDVRVSLDFDGAANDLDVYVIDNAGSVVVSGTENAGIDEVVLTEDLEPGIHYILVTQYRPQNAAAAVPYTLTVALPECSPSDFALVGCTDPTKPLCGETGTCGAGPTTCVGDTAGEPNDDGPAGARTLASGTPLTGQACTEDGELDWYKFTAAAGAGETISLAWTDPATPLDFDIAVVDATGKLYGQSWYRNPEVVTLTNLPAGTYYVRVQNFGTASTASTAYTITGTATPVTSCTDADACGGESGKTQVYRGQCNTNVCSFIAGAGAVANGAACDSTDDCTTGNRCSYIIYETDAQKSVCTPTSCANDAACTAINANLRCTTGFQTNICEPACTANTQCGTSTSATMPDANEPWNYFTCTVATGACAP